MPINIDGSKGIRQNTTEVTKIPVGTTAQRPSNPEAGMIRFNTDQGFVEWYDDVGDRWLATSSFPGVVANGGTVTDIEQDGQLFRVHTFTSDSTFDVLRGGEVECLVVAGGGGGGTSNQGGGGGAGDLIFDTLSIVKNTYPINVGGGGPPTSGSTGLNGGNTEAFSLTAIGGGGGGDGTGGSGGFGEDGGSGGGTADNPTENIFGKAIGNGFGNDGGEGQDGGTRTGAGGGGAGQPGKDGANNIGGDGGDGLDFSNVFGFTLGDDGFFAGGGAGGSRGTGGSKGKGGGGFAGFPATPNTGGGGGGGNRGNDAPDGPSGSSSNGQSGGSGIVIVRYRIG